MPLSFNILLPHCNLVCVQLMGERLHLKKNVTHWVEVYDVGLGVLCIYVSLFLILFYESLCCYTFIPFFFQRVCSYNISYTVT